MIDDKQILMRQLQRLRDEHHALDEHLSHLMQETIVDHMTIQAIKKQKLGLKDQIVQLENFLFPDIIAWIIRSFSAIESFETVWFRIWFSGPFELRQSRGQAFDYQTYILEHFADGLLWWTFYIPSSIYGAWL